MLYLVHDCVLKKLNKINHTICKLSVFFSLHIVVERNLYISRGVGASFLVTTVGTTCNVPCSDAGRHVYTAVNPLYIAYRGSVSDTAAAIAN